MIKAIIIDDEQHCIDRLSGLLQNNFGDAIEICRVATSVEAGLISIKKIQPDLIFLDVQIHDQTGFDLLKQIEKINFEIIFTTAYDKYAVQAFKFCAIDYLLKPVDESELQQAITKLEVKLSKEAMAGKLNVLFHNMKNLQNTSKHICVPVVSGFVFLAVSDIIRCQSDINYTTIYTKDKQKLMVAKTLKEFEEMLVNCNFYRVHNSHLVNLNCIKSYNKGKGGFITMTDNSEIEVATRRKEDFLKTLSVL